MDAKKYGSGWTGWARRWGLVAALALLVTACGGEEGVGAGGSGIVVGFGEGTVTSLGNVAIDGTVFDTSKAAVQTETTPGAVVAAQVKLGQHVEFDFKVDRVADAVRVEPQAVGFVDALGVGIFTVLGQRVRINTDPGVGPVTVFDGFPTNTLNDVRVGNLVEVHGLSRRDATGVYVLQATRVQALAVLPPQQRLTGVVTSLGVIAATGQRGFIVGDVVVAVGTSSADVERLANGQTVTVFGELNYTTGRFDAGFLRIKQRQNAGIDAYFGGTLTQVAADSFELNGVPVRFAGIAGTGFKPEDLQYVQLRGNFAFDGSLDTTAVSIRGASGVDTEVEIAGPITAYDPGSFTALVRGFVVRMSGARAQDCPAQLQVGLNVAIRGQAVAGGIVADRVRCIFD